MRKLISLFMAMLCLASVIVGALPAYADEDGAKEITVEFDGEYAEQMNGAVLSLYMVGTSEDGTLSKSADFMTFDAEAMDPEPAVGIAQEKSISPIMQIKVVDNLAHFSIANDGLYMIKSEPHVVGEYVYYGQPVLVSIPSHDTESNTDVDSARVFPKVERKRFEQSTESVACEVIVEWVDAGFTQYRPKNVSVSLIRNGEVLDVVELDEDVHWRHKWDGLHRETELKVSGCPQYELTSLTARHFAEATFKNLESWIDKEQKTTWEVKQNDVPRYSTTYRREGDTFIITNTIKADVTPSPSPSPKPSQEKPPIITQTGMIIWPIIVFGLAGIAFLIFGVADGKKKEK